MSTCPYCSYSLLRHIRHGKIYWFCSHCWQEVPNFETVASFLEQFAESDDGSKPEASVNS